MAETLPPYNLQYPDGTDDRADFPNLYQSNLIALSQLVIGQFSTPAAAQAALGSSSQSPVFYTTKSPSTLWCLDSSGARVVWTAGGAWKGTPFVWNNVGTDNAVSSLVLGNGSYRHVYEQNGATVRGKFYMQWGSTTNVGSLNGYYQFGLPVAAKDYRQILGSAQVICGGSGASGAGPNTTYNGIVKVIQSQAYCVVDVYDGAHVSRVGATLNASSSAAWTAGNSIQFSYEYEGVTS